MTSINTVLRKMNKLTNRRALAIQFLDAEAQQSIRFGLALLADYHRGEVARLSAPLPKKVKTAAEPETKPDLKPKQAPEAPNLIADSRLAWGRCHDLRNHRRAQARVLWLLKAIR